MKPSVGLTRAFSSVSCRGTEVGTISAGGRWVVFPRALKHSPGPGISRNQRPTEDAQGSAGGVPRMAARGRASLGHQRDRVLRGETGRPTSPLQAVCGEGAPGRRFLRAHRLRLTVKPPSPRKCAAPCPCIWGHHHPLFVPPPPISVQSPTVPGQGSSLVGAWKECKSGQVNKI